MELRPTKTQTQSPAITANPRPATVLEAEKNLALVGDKMEAAFRLSHKKFGNDIEDLQDQARKCQTKGDIRHLSSFLEQLDMLQKDTSMFFNKAHAFQSKESSEMKHMLMEILSDNEAFHLKT
jgi:hypothetical protein